MPRLQPARQGRRPVHRPGRRDAAAQRAAAGRTRCGTRCPDPVQQEIIDRRLRLFAIDADAVAREAGLPGRTNTVLQTCFFAISGVLPREEALGAGQGDHPQDLRPARPARWCGATRRPSTAPSRRWPRSRSPPRRAPGTRIPARRPGRRARVRPHRDRRDDGGPRRRPAGQRPAGRRHLPQRHDGLREAPDLRPRRRVGPRHVHPVRQLQLRLPAQRHPGQVRRRRRARGAPGGLLDAAAQRRRPAARRSTGCRSTSRTAPAAACASRPAR